MTTTTTLSLHPTPAAVTESDPATEDSLRLPEPAPTGTVEVAPLPVPGMPPAAGSHESLSASALASWDASGRPGPALWPAL